MKKICRNCRYYKRRIFYNVGGCSNKKFVEAKNLREVDMAGKPDALFFWSPEGYDSCLHVGERFGCIHWESYDEKENCEFIDVFAIWRDSMGVIGCGWESDWVYLDKRLANFLTEDLNQRAEYIGNTDFKVIKVSAKKLTQISNIENARTIIRVLIKDRTFWLNENSADKEIKKRALLKLSEEEKEVLNLV